MDGQRPDRSVTDANGHFHHVTNAYCADQALFTTVGSANPVLTGLCLARKVAEDVVDRHTGFVDCQTGLVRPASGIGLNYLPENVGDFDLAIEWKAFRTFDGSDAIANAGILLRTPDPGGVNFSDAAQFDTFYDATTEIQIDDSGKQYFKDKGQSLFGNSYIKTGALYRIAPARSWVANVASPDGRISATPTGTYSRSAQEASTSQWR